MLQLVQGLVFIDQAQRLGARKQLGDRIGGKLVLPHKCHWRVQSTGRPAHQDLGCVVRRAAHNTKRRLGLAAPRTAPTALGQRFGQRLGPKCPREVTQSCVDKGLGGALSPTLASSRVPHPNLRTPNLRRRSFGRNPRGLVWTWVRFGAQVAPPAQRPVQGAHCTHLTPSSMAPKVFWGAGLGAKVWAALRKIKAKESRIEMA